MKLEELNKKVVANINLTIAIDKDGKVLFLGQKSTDYGSQEINTYPNRGGMSYNTMKRGTLDRTLLSISGGT